MNVLLYIIIIFFSIQFTVMLVNLIIRDRLGAHVKGSGFNISVMIPARNEAHNIRNILYDLRKYQTNQVEILVADDSSEDETASVVAQLSKENNTIKLITLKELPPGWLGKNHACYKLSEIANGDYYLFIDADVRINADIINQSVAFMNKHQLSLLSIFPAQEIKSVGEWLTVPLMNYILLTLLPLILVRKSHFKSLAAANGQYMLFKAIDYKNLKPHFTFKNNRTEDIAIQQYFKANAKKTACLLGNNDIKCRMYNNLNDAINGFTKNTLAFFGNVPLLAILFWTMTTIGLFYPLMNTDKMIYYLPFILMVLTRIGVSLMSKQNVLMNVLMMIPQQIVLGLIIVKSIRKNYKNEHVWKGRKI